MNLYPECLDIVGAVGPAGEVGQVKLNLVPPLVQAHGHGANKRLDACGGLVVGGAEASADVLVVQDLHFEGEIFLEVLDDHHEEGELDAQRLLRIGGACDEVGGYVRALNFKHGGLDVLVCDAFNVSISYFFPPDLKRLAPAGGKWCIEYVCRGEKEIVVT